MSNLAGKTGPGAPEAGGPPRTILFVVGMWRSGTSLLHALLSRHPQIALMYEAEPFELWPASADVRWRPDWVSGLQFFSQGLSRHRLAPDDISPERNPREAALQLYRAFGANRNAAVIGEKSPAYHAWLPEISRLFPDARFVII